MRIRDKKELKTVESSIIFTIWVPQMPKRIKNLVD
jgi:hypothetical protein